MRLNTVQTGGAAAIIRLRRQRAESLLQRWPQRKRWMAEGARSGPIEGRFEYVEGKRGRDEADAFVSFRHRFLGFSWGYRIGGGLFCKTLVLAIVGASKVEKKI
ncbi:hypothetical protein QJS04_geneDACA020305 [Acorus gramineus]|uniref:Uncharacterized protein n=1 Tax=Acorus gramineus TaxID=55184 RepID=A0AAV9AAR3_ACOGR|nr:hypothetical protein QJS04_geneDACA020305 [Acorus gramineus]